MGEYGLIGENEGTIKFDGMTVFNKVEIEKINIKTCWESYSFLEVRELFDRYDEQNLKLVRVAL